MIQKEKSHTACSGREIVIPGTEKESAIIKHKNLANLEIYCQIFLSTLILYVPNSYQFANENTANTLYKAIFSPLKTIAVKMTMLLRGLQSLDK